VHAVVHGLIFRHLWRIPPRVIRHIPTPYRRIRLMNAYGRAHQAHPVSFLVRMRNGLLFHGNTRDVIQRNIYIYGVWEPEITRWLEGYLRLGDIVVDVGANTGYFSLQASRLVGPEGHVFAVEPVPSINAAMTRNIEVNQCSNILLFNVVASDTPGAVVIYRASEGNIGESSTVVEPGHISEGQVEAVRLDDLLEGMDDSAIRVVKIDTEGDEARVLAGMTKMLTAMRSGSAILVEVTPDKLALRDATELDVWRFFPMHEWIPHRINNDYRIESYLSEPAPPEVIDAPLGIRADLIFIKR
jgi:FkbM family methyltransferase